MNSFGRSSHPIAHPLRARLNGLRRPVGGNSRQRSRRYSLDRRIGNRSMIHLIYRRALALFNT